MHNYADLARQAGRISASKVKPYSKPSKEDLRKLWNSGYNPRDRALISFVNCTAIARQSLTQVNFSHFEKNWREQEIPHISLPETIIKGKGVQRYQGVRQETFLTPEAKRDLVDYVEWMERKGFNFDADSEVFRSIIKPYKAISYQELGVISERISKRAGIKFSWHDGRRFVETALEEARIHPNWCKKIRGRKVRGEESPYSRPKIAQLREAYKGAVQFLQFRTSVSVDVLEQRKQAMLDNAKLMGWNPEKVKGLELLLNTCQTKDMLDKVISEGIEKKLSSVEEDCQKIVDEQELDQWLAQGWRVITTLSSGKVVIESNNNHS